MLSIEQALSQYTEAILSGEDADLDSFLQRLQPCDRDEFSSSAQLISMLANHKTGKRFDSVFKKINQRREETFGEEQNVVDFRGVGDNETMKIVEQIFDEEFNDDGR